MPSYDVTGNTVSYALNGAARTKSLDSVLYAHLHRAEKSQAVLLVQARLRARGLAWVPVERALKQLPSCVPGEHRFACMRRLLNGELTTRRMSPVNGVEVGPCPFCQEPEGDSLEHRDVCPVVLAMLWDLSEVHAQLARGHLWLQADFASASVLQQALAFNSAVARVLRFLAEGWSFPSYEDLLAHVRRLTEDPWLVGSPTGGPFTPRTGGCPLGSCH